MDDQPYSICEACRERVDPSDPEVVAAFEVQRLDTMGGPRYVEGQGFYFHKQHFPYGSSRYRLMDET